jgi:hypothetical protein
MHSQSKLRWAARAGLILGPLAWAMNQQFTSEFTYAKCGAADLSVVLTSGILCGSVAISGLLLSWFARRSTSEKSLTSFTATLGALAGGMFLLVIIAGTMSGFMLPGCFQ